MKLRRTTDPQSKPNLTEFAERALGKPRRYSETFMLTYVFILSILYFEHESAQVWSNPKPIPEFNHVGRTKHTHSYEVAQAKQNRTMNCLFPSSRPSTFL